MLYHTMLVLCMCVVLRATTGHQSEPSLLAADDVCSPNVDGHVAPANCGVRLLQRSGRQAHRVKTALDFPLQTLVINLDRRNDRWEELQRRLLALNSSTYLSVKRLSATDGASDPIPIADVAANINKTKMLHVVEDFFDVRLNEGVVGPQQLLRDGERACAMSHLRAWRAIASGTQPVLVLEDDVVFDDSFQEVLASIQTVPQSRDFRPDVLHLQYTAIESVIPLPYVPGHEPWTLRQTKRTTEVSWKDKAKKVVDIAANHSIRHVDFVLESGGYVMWPEGAQKLLSMLPVDTPVDSWLAWGAHVGHWNSFAVYPLIVKQDEQGKTRTGSDIQSSSETSSGENSTLWQQNMLSAAMGASIAQAFKVNR